jgi:hypothetical protein
MALWCTTPGGNPVGGGGELAGEWQTANNEGHKAYVVLKSSGELQSVQFWRLVTFWVETNENVGTWSRGGEKYLYLHYRGNSGLPQQVEYTLSGNTLELRMCDRSDSDTSCNTVTATRGNIASTKKALGTVYNADTALYTKAPAWALKSDPTKRIEFAANDVSGGEYYVSGAYVMVWYTIGTRLFLADVNYQDNDDDQIITSVKSTAELDYKFLGSGDSLRLSLSPILSNGQPGIADIWLPVVEHDDDD